MASQISKDTTPHLAQKLSLLSITSLDICFDQVIYLHAHPQVSQVTYVYYNCAIGSSFKEKLVLQEIKTDKQTDRVIPFIHFKTFVCGGYKLEFTF